ncbi:MAG: hypothetical protein ACI4JY_04735 [Oscillospiraceae bacterium]
MRKKILFLLALVAAICVSGCTNLPMQNSSDISELTVQTTETGSPNAESVGEPIGQIDIFTLLNGYLNDENYICVNFNDIPVCEDYDLFRKHFFGVWNSADGYLSSDMILDDSENINFVRGYFGSFYQPSDNVLAFTVNNNAEGYLFWQETDSPDVMYSAPYYYGAEGSLFSTAYSTCILTKTDAAPNEPSDGFLSVFKLREMSRDRGIDFSLLTNIDGGFLDGMHLEHTATYNFFPMYLVSEADDKLVIKTSVGNILEKDLLPLDITCTFEKSGNEWTRTLDFADTSTLQ